MTSIYDIPYDDIKKFLLANNKNSFNKEIDYDETLSLLKDNKTKGHTTSIIEWMIAYNLLINNVDIPYYTIDDINTMSQNDINKLAKLLTMKGNNRNNIKNILRFLNKLDNDQKYLLPEINSNILNILSQLEVKDMDLYNLKYNNIISLLKTHHNKKEIRKFIYNNLSKIIIYNSIDFDLYQYIYDYIDNCQECNYYVTLYEYLAEDYLNIYNKFIYSQIIKDNRETLLKYYSNKEIDDLIEKINEYDRNDEGHEYIGKHEMYILVDFTLNLIEINEIGLAKKVFDISNDLHLHGRGYPYNVELVNFSISRTPKILKIIINYIGEEQFIDDYFENINNDGYEFFQDRQFLIDLVNLEKYDLLIKIIDRYLSENYNIKDESNNKTLKKIKDGINSDNKEEIIKYLNLLSL